MTNEATGAKTGVASGPRLTQRPALPALQRPVSHPLLRGTLRGTAVRLIVGAGLYAAASLAGAQVYKCQDATGRTIYADAPCDAKGKPMHLQDPTWRSGTDPNVCFQLLDELNRLADEVKRNEQRGRKESSSSATRRRDLTQQYETRCVGVSRAPKGVR